MPIQEAFIDAAQDNDQQLVIGPYSQRYVTVNVEQLLDKVKAAVAKFNGAEVEVSVAKVNLQQAEVTFDVGLPISYELRLELRRACVEECFEIVSTKLIGRLEMAAEMAGGGEATEEIWRALRLLAAINLPD